MALMTDSICFCRKAKYMSKPSKTSSRSSIPGIPIGSLHSSLSVGLPNPSRRWDAPKIEEPLKSDNEVNSETVCSFSNPIGLCDPYSGQDDNLVVA